MNNFLKTILYPLLCNYINYYIYMHIIIISIIPFIYIIIYI